MAIDLSNHNIFHSISVIISKFVNLIIASFIASYMIAIGFILSEEVLKNYLARLKLQAIYSYINTITFMENIKGFILKLIGPWYKIAPMWWAVVVGIPLILSGTSIILIGLTDFIYSLTNAAYNKAHCLFKKKEKFNNK